MTDITYLGIILILTISGLCLFLYQFFGNMEIVDKGDTVGKLQREVMREDK